MAIIPMMAQTHFDVVRQPLEYARWIPYFLLAFLLLVESAISGRLVRRFYKFDALIIGWLVFAFCSSLYSIAPELTFQRAGTLMLMYVAVFWTIWGIVTRQGEDNVIEMLLRAALVLYTVSWALLPVAEGMRQVDGRFRGWMENPNSLGLLAALLFPLALWRSLQRRWFRDHFLCALMFLSLILTGDRTGMVACFVGAMYVFWSARSHMFWITVGALVLIVISFAIEPLVLEDWSDNSYIRPTTLTTGSGRNETWSAAINIISERPLEGYGFGTEELLFESYGYDEGYFVESQGKHIHNAYLGLTAQTGISGALAFFLPLIYFAIRQLRRGLKDQQFNLTHALQATLFTGLILCVAESWIYSMGNAFAFPFWLSLMLLIRRALPLSVRAPSPRHLRLPSLLPLSHKTDKVGIG